MGIYRSEQAFQAAIQALEDSSSLEEARAKHGIPDKTLRDYMARNGLGSPSSRLKISRASAAAYQPPAAAQGSFVDSEGRPLWRLPEGYPTRDIPRVGEFPSFGTLRLPEPRHLRRIFVIPDMHHPHADATVWACMVNAIAVLQPTHVVSIGDFVDLSSVMFHAKGPSSYALLRDEVAPALRARAEVDLAAGDAEKFFILGNHEDRLRRYMAANAPALDGLVDVESLLELDKYGWVVIPYKESMKIGEITFTHDIGRCGKYVAHQNLADYGDNIVTGHAHRASVVYGGTVGRKTHVSMCVGNGLDYETVDYRHRDLAYREWQHGFGWIYMDSDGVGWANFMPIINGKCVVEGKEIRA